MAQLTADQLHNLLAAHCYRVITDMQHDDLIAYASTMMMQCFEIDPGQGNYDLEMLVADIYTAEGDDDDSAHEFIAGVLGDDLAHQLMAL
jgi:hypothetical protein